MEERGNVLKNNVRYSFLGSKIFYFKSFNRRESQTLNMRCAADTFVVNVDEIVLCVVIHILFQDFFIIIIFYYYFSV